LTAHAKTQGGLNDTDIASWKERTGTTVGHQARG